MATQRIGIAGGTPTWRRGVASVLEGAGYATAEFDTIEVWRPGRGGKALFFHVSEPEELTAVATFAAEHPHIPLIVVTPELGITEFAAIIKAGAIATVAADEPISVLISVLDQALDGRVSAPPAIVKALAMRIVAGFGETPNVGEPDRNRLHALASGRTVAQLAADEGFSEREMFRILGDMYARLGVTNRTDAIVWATRHGLLDDDPARGATRPQTSMTTG